MNQPTQTWLTQEAADRLKAELASFKREWWLPRSTGGARKN